MAELEKENLQNSETGNEVAGNEPLLATIEAIQKNSVPKEKYDALNENYTKLAQAVANGQEIALEENQADLKPREEYYKAYKENKFANDLEFWENFVNLREATIKELGSDPCVTGSYGFTPDGGKLEPSYGEAETIEEQMDLIKDMIKEADGNPFAFKAMLSSALPKR